ncbi:MAG: universal stress protein [Bacteroidota bacterium]|jgi:nucleotide-binding universal stress UspA family protein
MSEENTTLIFEKIGIAIAFSPRLEAIIAEASKMQKGFHANLVFIHIGQKNIEDENTLNEILAKYDLLNNSKLIWKEGEPVESILQICEEENIDLLVAGALEKESLIKYFMGSIARKLSRRVKCSMLMLTEPSVESMPLQHIVVEGSDNPKTETTIAKAIEIAKAFNVKNIDIIQETDLNKAALIRSDEFRENEMAQHKERMIEEEDKKLEYILSCNDCSDLKINTERIEGKPGYVITKYAREHNADLLVLNSPDRKLNLIDRVFPTDIEFALADLPCNLLIVNEDNVDF